MSKKAAIGLIVVLAVLAAGLVWRPVSLRTAGGDGKPQTKVVTTLFPLYDMARFIGGDKAEVRLLVPPGVEPHAFEPTPRDAVAINTADIFVYTGSFMEPWAEDVIKGVTNKELQVADASRGTTMAPGVFEDADEPAGSLDPHIWLDFDNARIMAENIALALEEKDAANRSFYAERAAEYSRQLLALDGDFRSGLGRCERKEIVYAGHYAFGYLARRYGLNYVAAQGVAPDAEPTAQDLARLIDQIRRDNIQYVFYEELTSPKIAETVARETKAKLLLLNAAHNLGRDQFEQGITFFDILKSDLDNLKTGLKCQP